MTTTTTNAQLVSTKKQQYPVLFLVVSLLALLGMVYVTPSLQASSPVAVIGTELQEGASKEQFHAYQIGNASLPGGLRLAFAGDSITRFTYRSLTYLLTHGRWAPDPGFVLVVKKRIGFNGWVGSSLEPNEACDCYHHSDTRFENRYFSSGESLGDNYITFFGKFGIQPFHGHWSAPSIRFGPLERQDHNRSKTLRRRLLQAEANVTTLHFNQSALSRPQIATNRSTSLINVTTSLNNLSQSHDLPVSAIESISTTIEVNGTSEQLTHTLNAVSQSAANESLSSNLTQANASSMEIDQNHTSEPTVATNESLPIPTKGTDSTLAAVLVTPSKPLEPEIPKVEPTPFDGGLLQTGSEAAWVHDWGDFVDQYLANLSPRPNIFVFNQGIWPTHDLGQLDKLLSLKEALERQGIRGIYRTTTFKMNETNFERDRYSSIHIHDDQACELFECWNVSWTASVPESEYIDPAHFQGHIYNRMMTQFIEEHLNFDLQGVPPMDDGW